MVTFIDFSANIAPSITGVTAGNLVVMLVACSQNTSNTAFTGMDDFADITIQFDGPFGQMNQTVKANGQISVSSGSSLIDSLIQALALS